MPTPFMEVLGGSILLALILTPTGLALLRFLELLLHYRLPLNPVERVLIAFYSTGFLFFVLASIPWSAYGLGLTVVTLGLGTSLYTCWLWRDGMRRLWATFQSVARPEVVLVVAGTLGLFLFEILPVWNLQFPNSWDGSVTALWTSLIIRHGTVPTSLEPFSNAPVIYPMGTSVWMTLPVMVFGWSVVQTPVLLPPLFLSLTIPAAYSWGWRWTGRFPEYRIAAGLLFTVFFGLVASWPRLYSGGSYDFALALPLLLVTIGFLPEWAEGHGLEWPTTVGLGLAGAILVSLSLAAGEEFVILGLAYAVAQCRRGARQLCVRLLQLLVIVGFEMVSIVRSLWGWLHSYGSAYSPGNQYGALDFRLVQGELNPFVLWKYKVSPFLPVSVGLQILLGVGLLLSIWYEVVTRKRTVPPSFETTMSRFLLTGTAAALLLTVVLVLTDLPGAWSSAMRTVTNLDQSSIILFIFFAAIALFPLMVAGFALSSVSREKAVSAPPARPVVSSHTPPRGDARSWLEVAKWRVWLVAILIVIPIGLGATATVVQGPNFLSENAKKTSNVTTGDVAVLEWAGAELPQCSTVLVAPGSAAQFLPEYVTVRLDFPMNPVPQNQSYQTAVTDLTSGFYTNTTRAALVDLGVTEVFVTGQTSVSFAPFLPQPLEASSDFTLLDRSGDALIFGFLPVMATTDCPA